MSLEDDVKGWAQSVTIWGAVLGAVVNIGGSVLNYEFPSDFTTVVATAGAGIVTAIITIYGRIKAVKKIG